MASRETCPLVVGVAESLDTEQLPPRMEDAADLIGFQVLLMTSNPRGRALYQSSGNVALTTLRGERRFPESRDAAPYTTLHNWRANAAVHRRRMPCRALHSASTVTWYRAMQHPPLSEGERRLPALGDAALQGLNFRRMSVVARHRIKLRHLLSAFPGIGRPDASTLEGDRRCMASVDAVLSTAVDSR